MNASETSDAPPSPPIALVTGATAGLGLAIGRALLRKGYQVILVARDAQRLSEVAKELSAEGAAAPVSLPCDVSDPARVQQLGQQIDERYGRLDVLVNVVGTSDRGMVVDLNPQRVQQLITANVVTALLCSQACLPLLERCGGCVINIGSLASKVGARYLGGYPLAKHALAGLTQQMRLEWRPRGVHVGLISPGPIRRADAGRRYEQQVQHGSELPAQAAQPGGGTRVKGLPPERVAEAVMRMIRRRSADVILPWHLRPLVAIGHCWPALGDWLLLRFTSSSASRTATSSERP